jgi:hypothetical protein
MKSELLILILDNILGTSLFIFSIVIVFIIFDKYSNYNAEIKKNNKKNNNNLKFNVSKVEIIGSNISLLIPIIIVSLFFTAIYFIENIE